MDNYISTSIIEGSFKGKPVRKTPSNVVHEANIVGHEQKSLQGA